MSVTSDVNYKRWLCMRERCYNTNHVAYKNYGGRGIVICSEWINDFNKYRSYITTLDNANNSGYTVDRIDNDKGYVYGNIAWSTKSTQAFNRRPRRNKTGYKGVTINKKKIFVARVTVNGKRLTVGSSKSLENALAIRNSFILDNNLKQQIQGYSYD